MVHKDNEICTNCGESFGCLTVIFDKESLVISDQLCDKCFNDKKVTLTSQQGSVMVLTEEAFQSLLPSH